MHSSSLNFKHSSRRYSHLWIWSAWQSTGQLALISLNMCRDAKEKAFPRSQPPLQRGTGRSHELQKVVVQSAKGSSYHVKFSGKNFLVGYEPLAMSKMMSPSTKLNCMYKVLCWPFHSKHDPPGLILFQVLWNINMNQLSAGLIPNPHSSQRTPSISGKTC